MRALRRPVLIVMLACLLAWPVARARAAAPAECGVPTAMPDGWKTATPASVGLDPAILCAIGPRVEAWKQANVHAVLVVRHGRLVYEHYFTGEDHRPDGSVGPVAFDATTKHDLRSITKSVVSLVLGIGIAKGQIAGIDQPVLRLLPAYADLRTPEKDRITLRHLLTMSQGLRWNEDLPYSDAANNETAMDAADDPVRYTLSQPVDSPAGKIFNYSGGSAVIIARLLHDATGKWIDALAREELFGPLGITDFDWRPIASGEPSAASGLRLKPRDTVKLGQLVLNRGTWDGRRIVPAAWIAAATSPQINAYQAWFYGFQFWLGRSLVNGREIDWSFGQGYGGQRLFIVPSLDLVVLVHCGMYESPIQGAVPLSILNRNVLAAVTDAR